MTFEADKVTVVEADSSLRERVSRILADAGYQVSAESSATLKTILQSGPDVIVLGANPPQLDCCNLLADVKGSEEARHIRVIMLAVGGPAERVRGLELGADDVLSLPFDDRELLARVRTHLREKKPEDQLREVVRHDKQSRRQARRLLHAMNEGRRTLRIGIVVVAACALVAAGAIAFLYWRSQKQNVRVYAALAKLQTGVISERELIELAHRARTEAERNAAPSIEADREALKRTNEELHNKMAAADRSQVAALEKELRASDQRLQKLEAENKVAQDVIKSYSSGVCLLHVAVGFRDKLSGLTLRYSNVTPPSALGGAENSDVQVQIGGIGAEVRMDTFGTGFLVSSDGRIITNHHVAEPWWKNDAIGEILKRAPNLEPTVTEMTAYFPGLPRGIPVKVDKISSEADVAVVAGSVSGLSLKQLALNDDPKAAISGAPIVLLGYPTGINAILARSSEDTLRSIAASTNGDLDSVMEELARRKLIRPVSTQGHVGDVLADQIVYDAQTTSGGSGGPLFSSDGKVIAVNVAMLRDFGGSNFAIPIRYARRLLAH